MTVAVPELRDSQILERLVQEYSTRCVTTYKQQKLIALLLFLLLL